MLVRQGVEVVEVQRGLDMDGTDHPEGRVLAVKLQSVWVLGLYAPHPEAHLEHLLEQVAAWMSRDDKAVVVAGDINTILADSLDEGIRVHTTSMLGEVPSNYFS